MFKTILYSLSQVSGKDFLKVIDFIGHIYWNRFEIVKVAFRTILPIKIERSYSRNAGRTVFSQLIESCLRDTQNKRCYMGITN